jgi:hypothetical protein
MYKMSIIVLMYHRHKLLDTIYGNDIFYRKEIWRASVDQLRWAQ